MLNKNLNSFIDVIQTVKNNLNCKIFLVDHIEKHDDVNDKLLFDLKFATAKNLLKIFSQIKSVHKAQIYNKLHHIKENNFYKLFMNEKGENEIVLG